jgi:hypothetical protein
MATCSPSVHRVAVERVFQCWAGGLRIQPLPPVSRPRGATFRPHATSHHHDSLHTHIAARRIVMDLAAAVMLFSIVLYMLQQVEDLVA